MSDLSQPIQAAIYGKLTGNSTLMALITGVYDFVNADATFPYLTIGNLDATDASTFSKDAQSITLHIHAWSRVRGKKEAQLILSAVHDVLHKGALTVSGGQVAGMKHEYSTVFIDTDGLTHHGVARYMIFAIEA